MGTTEFLMAMLTSPELVETLMEKITAFLKNWLRLQRDTFSTIDGIFLLDDIIGFIGEQEFCRFGLPYFKELFSADVSVKFLHNDAQCRVSVPYLPEIGVNLFNMGFDVSLNDIKTWTNNQVTLLGNIPPRDVLANGKPEDVVKSVTELLDSLEDQTRVILSCGGGLPPGVSTENLKAFIETVKNYTLK